MFSKEDFEFNVNSKIAEMIVERLALLLQSRMQDQWNRVVFELASTRKTMERTKEALAQTNKLSNQIQKLTEQLQRDTQKTRSLREKEDRLLTFLLKEFGMEE